MEWTTDPLVRRNGYFNLTKLGARAPEYLVNVYGEMRDGINAGEESDRLLIRWHLDSEDAERAAAGGAKEPDIEALKKGGARVLLSPPLTPTLTPERGEGATLLIQVPSDIVALRREEPAAARAWRLALRDASTRMLSAGYEITGATRDGWYVLELK
jgi:predicted GNAT superfamily acetyltransferase